MTMHSLRVLVAEDEPLARLVLEDVLSAEGHDVLLAVDGRQALDLAAENPFDVLVTDLSMPRMTGLELVQELRTHRPGLPVVVMTGYLPPGGLAQLMAGASAPTTVLHKPFELDQLLRALEAVPRPAGVERPLARVSLAC